MPPETPDRPTGSSPKPSSPRLGGARSSGTNPAVPKPAAQGGARSSGTNPAVPKPPPPKIGAARSTGTNPAIPKARPAAPTGGTSKIVSPKLGAGRGTTVLKKGPSSARPPLRARVVGWWRRRGKAAKALVAAGLVLVGLPLAYVFLRTIGYAIASGTSIEEVAPDTAHLYVRLRDFSGFLDGLETQPAWTAVRDRVLHHHLLRGQINAQLAAAGAPTLDQLDDPRWLGTDGRLFSRASLKSLLGRDAVVAVRREGEATDVLVVTRLTWLQYLGAPFARFLYPSTDVAGRSCLTVNGWWVSLEGAYAVAGRGASMAADVGVRPYRPAVEPVSGPLLEVRFPPGPDGERWREIVGGYPLGLFTYMVDWGGARGVAAEFRVEEDQVICDARILGGRVASKSTAVVDLSAAAPSDAFLLMPSQCAAPTMWDWARRFASAPPPATAQMATVHDVLRTQIEQMEQAGFSARVLPLLDGPTMVILGISQVETQEGTRPGASVAVVLGSTRPREAYDAFTRVFDEVSGRDPNFAQVGEMREETFGEWRLRRFVRREGSSLSASAVPFVPAYAETNAGLVLGTQPDVVHAVHSAYAESRTFASGPVWTGAQARLAAQGMADLLDPQAPAGMIASLASLPSAVDAYVDVLARRDVESPEHQTEVRQALSRDPQIQAALRNLPSGEPREEYLDEQVRVEIGRQLVRRRQELRDEVQFFNEFGIAAMRMREEGTDLLLRGLITFKR